MGTRIFPLLVATLLTGAAAPRGAQIPAATAASVWTSAHDGATMSPDGKNIAFIDWNTSDVAVRDVAAGTERLLPVSEPIGFPEPYFVFSPSGNRLLYPYGNSRDGAPFRYELRRVGIANGVHETLAVFPPDVAFVAPLDWHAESGILFLKVAADAAAELLVMDPESRKVRTLHRQAADAGVTHQALFTPDSRSIVYLAGTRLFWISEGRAVRAVGLDAEALLGWSADGRTVLFNGTRDGVTGNWSTVLRDGKSVGEPVFVNPTAPGVRPAGRTAAGVHYVEAVETPSLFLANIDIDAGRVRGAPEAIVAVPGTIPGNPAWSRDGARLAYTLTVPYRSGHRIMVSEGFRGRAQEVARVALRVMGLDWSADGRFLVAGGRAGTRDAAWIGRIDVESGAIERLASNAPTNAVAAGADGSVVYARAALAGSRSVPVTVLPSNAAPPRVLATYTAADLPRALSVSPDGKWVALIKSIDERKATALMMLPVAGGEPRTVLRLERPDAFELNQGTIPFTADGRRVLVLVRRKGQRHFAAVDVESGQVTALPFAPHQGGRRQPTLHPDGRQLVYVDGAGRDELKVISGPAPR